MTIWEVRDERVGRDFWVGTICFESSGPVEHVGSCLDDLDLDLALGFLFGFAFGSSVFAIAGREK